jgi:hypothetical protein
MTDEDLSKVEYNSNDELIDIIARIKETDSGLPEVSFYKTKDLFTPFVNLFFENNVLRSVVKNQWRSYKYNQEYLQFLLDGYTEKEFMSVADKYALPFLHIDRYQLSLGASVILNVLGETITSGDLSFLLNVDPADLNLAIESYPLVSMDKETEDKEGDEKE